MGAQCAFNFFKVFFNDDAPYTQSLQKKRGVTLILKCCVWKDVNGGESTHIHAHAAAKGQFQVTPSNFVLQERSLYFKAKTNFHL
jgi:hypothetical protein